MPDRSGACRSAPGTQVAVCYKRPCAWRLVAHGGTPLSEVDLSGRVTFLLGAEREGLPASVERDVDATIPLVGAESLNVAAAGAIALYEWRRSSG